MKNAFIFIVLAAVVVAGVIYYENKHTTKTPMEQPPQITTLQYDQLSAAATSTAPGTEFTTQDGLKVKDMETGSGPAAKAGDRVTVNYVGMFPDGKMFDTSLQPGRTPFQFTLGAGNVIKGWDEGVQGMQVGGVRVLTVPSALGYGPTGNPPVIPGNATLLFSIQLLAIN